MEAIPLNGIRALIPHRGDALLLDAMESVTDHSGIGIVDIKADKPALRGHYPGNPIFPAWAIHEAACQAAGVVLARTIPTELMAERVPVFAKSSEFAVLATIRPGDQLIIEISEAVARVTTRRGVASAVAEVYVRRPSKKIERATNKVTLRFGFIKLDKQVNANSEAATTLETLSAQEDVCRFGWM